MTRIENRLKRILFYIPFSSIQAFYRNLKVVLLRNEWLLNN
jgi:hypothetical protein